VIVEAILYLPPLNKNFTLRKVLLTSLAVAPIAEQSVNNAMVVAIQDKVSVPDLGKCMTLLAPPVANQPKFLLDPAVTGPYTVVIAIQVKTVAIN